MELIFYRKLLSLFGGLIIIIELANAGMVPIGHPNNAKGNRPPFGKPINNPGLNNGPSVTVHGRPDRPGVNNGYGPQPAMSFGIQQKPPNPSSFASSQSSVGNSQSHLIYTQNTAGAGADPVLIVASTQNALNETENTHTVPLEQMATIFSSSLTETNTGNSQVPDPQTPAQDPIQQIPAHVENPHQNEVQTVPEISNQNNAVHVGAPILSDAGQTAVNLQMAGQESLAAHLPSDIATVQNEISVANNSPENIPLSETNSPNVVTQVEAHPPSSYLEAYPATPVSQEVVPTAVHSPINSHVDATAISSPSYAEDDDENHFNLEAYLAQANMVLGTSSSPVHQQQVQPVQSASVLHPSEHTEAVEMNIVETSNVPASSILVPVASDPVTSSILAPQASDLPASSILVPEASVPQVSPVSESQASIPQVSPVSESQASIPSALPIIVPVVEESVPQILHLPETPSIEIQQPVPENLQLVETPSIEIQEPLPIPGTTEIQNSQNEITASHIVPVSDENLSNEIPAVLSEQAILAMPNEVFEESVLNIEIAHQSPAAQPQSNHQVEQLSENITADVSPIAPITINHNEHVPIPSIPEASLSNAEEALPLLSEASQVAPASPIVNVQLEEALPEVQETNASPPLPPISATSEETAINAVVEASSSQIADAIVNHTPLNVEAQNIYSSPIEVQSESNNAAEDYDDPPFNVEQYLAQAALLLGSKSYQPYVHDDLQGSANDLYYNDKPNFQQSPEQFGKDKIDSAIVKRNQYYTHFGNKFTSHGTGREHDGNNLKVQPTESNANIADKSTSATVKNNELTNKVKSPDTPISKSHSSHAADTRPLPGPPNFDNLDENTLLTVVNPGNENEFSGGEDESQLSAESNSAPAEENKQSFSSKAEMERARPFRPGFARPSSLGLAPMYSYSGGVLNTPLGEDIKLTEYSNIIPVSYKNPNATVATAAEPVKFPHNNLMPLLGSSSFNSKFNGTHTNISIPNTAASFIMAQPLSIPSPQTIPSVQQSLINNSNIVTSMNNSQLKPTEFQSYYFPQESVKFTNMLVNNGGIRPLVGSKNIVESVVFMVPPKTELETQSTQNDFGNLNPEQSVVDLGANDQKKAPGNNHHVKRTSASGKSLDKANSRVSDSGNEDIADSELLENPAAAEAMKDNNEKQTESYTAPENSVDPVVSDNSSIQKENKDTSVPDALLAQVGEQSDEGLNKEVGFQPLEEQKAVSFRPLEEQKAVSFQPLEEQKEVGFQPLEEQKEAGSQPLDEQKEVGSQAFEEQKEVKKSADNEPDFQLASEDQDDDLDNDLDSQPVSEEKEDASENEADSLPAAEEKEDDLEDETVSQPASEEKDDDSENEADYQPASEKNEDASENEGASQLALEEKEDDSREEAVSQPDSEEKEDHSESEADYQPASEKNEDASENVEAFQPASELADDDLNNKSEPQPNEEQESDLNVQQENVASISQPDSEVQETEKKKEADDSSIEDEYETSMEEEKEDTRPAKAVPSKGNPSKTQPPLKDSPPKGQIPPKEAPPKAQMPSKETPPKSPSPPKEASQKPPTPSKDAPQKPQTPSKEAVQKPQTPSKESHPKENPQKGQTPSKEIPSKESQLKPQTPSKESPPKDSPPKPQSSSQENSPKQNPQAPQKDNPPRDPPPKAQAPPPSPPQKDAGPPAPGPSGPGLPPLPPPPALIAPPDIQAIAPNLDQLQFMIPEPQFMIPEPQFSIPEPNMAPASPPDISDIIGAVNIPQFPTIDGNKSSNNKGLPNSPKPKPPKRPSTSNAPSKGTPTAQQSSPADPKPQVSPATLQHEILETVEVYEEQEELSAADMSISEELKEEEDDESMNLNDQNEIQPQLDEEPTFTNEKALPNKNGGRPNFPPGFGNPNPPNPMPNPMFGNPAYGPGAFPQVTPGSLSGANPDKGCTCNSNSSPGTGGTNNNDKTNNNGGGKPNNNNSNSNNDKGNNSGGGKPNANNNANSNNDKGNSNGGGKPSPNNSGTNNNDKGNSGKHPAAPSKYNPAPTAAPVPVIDMDSDNESNSNVRPPRPTKPKRPSRPNGGGKKPKPKPSDKNNDKLKDVEVEDDLDPDFLQAIANNTNIVFTPPKITDSKLQNKPVANNAPSPGPQNTPTKQTELFTIYSIFGWEIPVINWSYFTDIFQSFFVEKFRTSSGEFTCDESSDNEVTILRSELDVDYLCGDDIDYGRRDIRTLADSNICNMFCNSNGYSSGLCMPQKSCLCYMSEKKNFAIKLDRLADFTTNSTEKESGYGEDSCQNCRCLKSCQNNGKYVGYCSKSCHCGVPWYNEDPEITQSSSPQA